MSVLASERDTYQAIWANDSYAAISPGERYADVFQQMAGATSGTVLDAGTGSGKGALALMVRGFSVDGCDLTPDGLVPDAKRTVAFREVCLWGDLKRQLGQRDYVYCCDVMEHIPTSFTMLVAQRLIDVAITGVFFSIALVPDTFGQFVGHPLHKTIQSFVEWRDQLSELGRMVECRDLGQVGLYLVAPR